MVGPPLGLLTGTLRVVLPVVALAISQTHCHLVPFAGLIAEQFLETTAAQLTYHGLCELTAAAKEGELSVFFRNNHFSTMTKHKVMRCWRWRGGECAVYVLMSFPSGSVFQSGQGRLSSGNTGPRTSLWFAGTKVYFSHAACPLQIGYTSVPTSSPLWGPG